MTIYPGDYLPPPKISTPSHLAPPPVTPPPTHTHKVNITLVRRTHFIARYVQYVIHNTVTIQASHNLAIQHLNLRWDSGLTVFVLLHEFTFIGDDAFRQPSSCLVYRVAVKGKLVSAATVHPLHCTRQYNRYQMNRKLLKTGMRVVLPPTVLCGGRQSTRYQICCHAVSRSFATKQYQGKA